MRRSHGAASDARKTRRRGYRQGERPCESRLLAGRASPPQGGLSREAPRAWNKDRKESVVGVEIWRNETRKAQYSRGQTAFSTQSFRGGQNDGVNDWVKALVKVRNFW
ncbi:MAG: hypothetical protein HY001_01690 [Candidatus Portnoybacteria bacterium]|nr:hypothetical protein [Candidatus Portnoybacteria bacterium]